VGVPSSLRPEVRTPGKAIERTTRRLPVFLLCLGWNRWCAL